MTVERERIAHILKLACTIGNHWREQEGLNAVLLDELAHMTKGLPELSADEVFALFHPDEKPLATPDSWKRER